MGIKNINTFIIMLLKSVFVSTFNCHIFETQLNQGLRFIISERNMSVLKFKGYRNSKLFHMFVFVLFTHAYPWLGQEFYMLDISKLIHVIQMNSQNISSLPNKIRCFTSDKIVTVYHIITSVELAIHIRTLL